LDRKHHSSSIPEATGGAGSQNKLGASALCFGTFKLDADGTLSRDGATIHVPPRELAALRVLLTSPGQVVTPARLKEALWGDVHVTAESVTKCLSSLRAHLEPDDCIQTVYKRGYRLTTDVHPCTDVAGAYPRLAIPPFRVEGHIAEHLGATIAEETIARLSNAPHPLAAILSRESVFTLAARGLTAHEIGQALRADLALSGTLRPINAMYRLRVEMIRVADGTQMWVEDLLTEPDRVSGIESELAARLDFRFKGKANPATEGDPSEPGPDGPPAGGREGPRAPESSGGTGTQASSPAEGPTGNCAPTLQMAGQAIPPHAEPAAAEPSGGAPDDHRPELSFDCSRGPGREAGRVAGVLRIRTFGAGRGEDSTAF
jgi:DNA-binding winged helix-turn-helix (wHTH) protein